MRFSKSAILFAILFAAAFGEELRIPLTEAQQQWAEAEAVTVVNAVAANDFKLAFSHAEAITARYPDAPHGYMMSVFARAIYVNCYRTKSQRARVLEDAHRVEETVARLMKIYPDDRNLKFYLGGALGYRGMLEMSEGSYFSALSTGIKAVNALDDAVKTAPPVWDAYFGLAIFHFTRYNYSKIFPWLSAGRDDHERAYQYLDLALTKGTFCRHEALLRAITFAMVDRRWEGLEARMLEAKARFPENIYLRYRMLDYYTTREQWPAVIPLARETLEKIQKEAGAGVSAQFLVMAHLANALARSGARAEAEELVRRLERDQDSLEPWVDNPRMLELFRRARDVLRRNK